MKVKLLDIRRILTQITRKTMDKPILLIATGKDIDVVELQMTEGSASDSYQSNHVDKQTSHEPKRNSRRNTYSQSNAQKITRNIILVRNYNLSD